MISTVNTIDHDLAFIQFYQAHPMLKDTPMPTRITIIAEYFLGQPYRFEPLGESTQGTYSNLPLYRADQFDCVTFVDTVLALTHAMDFNQFKEIMLHIRYKDQQIDYTKRTDWFTDLEWNPHLQQLGFIQDVTLSILDEYKQPIAAYAKTMINKPEWFAQKILLNLDLPHLSPDETQARLIQLQAEGKKFTAQPSTLSYIPFKKMFDVEGRPNTFIWKQLPSVSVIEIVRPNWRPVNPKDKKTDYGTHLNVTHLGIAVHTPLDTYFYHASTGNTVVKVLLKDYLFSFINDSRDNPVCGIHIEKII